MDIQYVSHCSTYKRHMLLRKKPNELQHSKNWYLSFFSPVVFRGGDPKASGGTRSGENFLHRAGLNLTSPRFRRGELDPSARLGVVHSSPLPQTLSPVVFPGRAGKIVRLPNPPPHFLHNPCLNLSPGGFDGEESSKQVRWSCPPHPPTHSHPSMPRGQPPPTTPVTSWRGVYLGKY